jgi:uncharacterized phage-associated protein
VCSNQNVEREMSHRAVEIADYLLFVTQEAGDLLTNLKLQKLLYYSQAWYLANYQELLFEEPIEAWVHGPVVVDVYHKYKTYGCDRIGEMITEPPALTKREIALINEVINVYGKYTAWDLERITHSEDPWIITRKGIPAQNPSNEIIDPNILIKYYGKKIGKTE